MRVLMLSIDKKVFEEGSAVRNRMKEYGELFGALHIVVHAPASEGHVVEQIGANTWLYPTNSKNKATYLFDCIRLIKNTLISEGALDADVVTAQDPETGVVAWRIARKYKKKLHLQLHSDYFSPYYSKGRFRFLVQKWLLMFLIPQADGIRVVSEKIKEDIVTRFPYQKKIIRVLPIYTDPSIFQDGVPSFDLHAKYPQFKFIILSVLRFTHEKNIELMLKVLNRVVGEYPNAGLVIVGAGPEERKIRTKITELKLEQYVVLEPWQNDLISYYRSANLFLLTSYYEGYGRTLVEAAAAGLPFVTSDVGLASSLPQDFKSTLVCPVDDIECFVAKIKSFITGHELTVSFRVNMRDDILKTLSPSKEEYLNAYKSDIEETWYSNIAQ